MKRRNLADKYCPVARASAQIVDGWTFIVLREIFLGNARFSGLQKQTGMSPRSLTLRLRKLVEEGILERSPSEEGKSAKVYALTPKGHGLWPALIMLKQWGEEWCGPWEEDGSALRTEHRGTDHEMHAILVCQTCGEPVSTHTTRSVLSRCMQAERDAAEAV
jgi:DNA-binding HxlR family transcriptional regulator